MSYSQRSSILSLLFKKGDPLCLDNYRPISISEYVQNRFIGFNLKQIQDIIDYADIYKIKGAIIVVDFTKAFDSLEWNVMLNTFKHFGFNESFINLVKTLYTDIQTCVMNTMIGNFKMGGLNVIDIESYFASLRASWVSRFVSGYMDNWKLIPYTYFRQFGKNWLIFSMNIEYKNK
jgi:hypothetical protein